MIYRTVARHLSSEAHNTHVQILPCRPSPRSRSGKYDALDSSYHDWYIGTGQSRCNHPPYSEPTILISSCESIPTATRPRSNGAALDRGGLFVSQVSQLGRKILASCISSREPSPDSQASFSLSVTDSLNILSHLHRWRYVTDAL